MRVPFMAMCAVACSISTWCAAEPATHPTPFVIGVDRFHQPPTNDSRTGGMLLLTELSCTACHAAPSKDLAPKRGPRLDAAGSRLQPEWMRRFLSDPARTKPGTTMPHVLHKLSPEDRERTIAALVAFLSSKQPPFRVLNSTAGFPIAFEFWRKGNVARGRKLYHEIGCVACHAPAADYESAPKQASPLEKLLAQLDPEDIKELGLEHVARSVKSIPLGELAAKYTPISLTYFLLEPEAVRPAGRMPNLKLHPTEAADIAGYLLRSQANRDPTPRTSADDTLIAKGRELFTKLDCVKCHDSGEKPSRASVQLAVKETAKPLVKLNAVAGRSCIADAGKNQPRFVLDAHQTRLIRDALRFLSETKEPTKSADVIARHQLEFRMLQLNCYGCHERNKRGGVGPQRRPFFETVGHVDIGDEGRLPPPLDHVGNKLTTKWLAEVFGGTGVVRPHMTVRMPTFPVAEVKSFPGEFATVDGYLPKIAQDVFGESTGLANAGRRLLDTGCVQCHSVRGEHLPGVVGIDLATIRGRIHPAWLREFLLNPSELKPRTRMPTFFPNGRSANKAVLDGNVDRQLAAMWAYLKDIDKQPLPEKILTGKEHNFELKPTDRPLIVRTFMRDAGTHAIAVGFKDKVHIAFDADRVRLAQVWRGRFIDAHGTWFNRFQPPIVPLGVQVIRVPEGVPLAVLENPLAQWPSPDDENHGYRFGGFRLDKSGVPTFLYRFGTFNVEDRFVPSKHQSLARQLRIIADGDAKTSTVWIRANSGKTLKPRGALSYQNDAGLRVTVDKNIGDAGELRRTGALTEWIIPVKIGREVTIRLTYVW